MAKIQAASNEKEFSIKQFLGINESPEGDVNLKYGEAAAMRNFRITDDLSLQLRPGTKTKLGLCSGYGTSVSSSTSVVLTESGASTKTWTLYPDIAIGSDGVLTVCGTGVSVTYANYSTYVGYYYKDDNGVIYKLASVTVTTPTTGVLVDGGSVSIADEALFYVAYYSPASGNSNAIWYTGVQISNGTVAGTGTGETGSTYLGNTGNSNIYKYTRMVASFSGFSDTTTYEYYGGLVSLVAQNTVAWNFYTVTKASTSTDTAINGLWYGAIANFESFTGDGSKKVFTLASSAKPTKVTIDGESAAYVYDSAADTVTFTVAPAASAAIKVYEDSSYHLVAACDGHLYKITTGDTWAKTSLGSVNTANGRVHMFGFDGKLYILDGEQYRVWDGVTLSSVTGYRPLVITAAAPAGGGTALEEVNKLCGLRRERFSPTGGTTFQLSEKGLTSIDYVKNLVSGVNYTLSTDYSANTTTGLVTFISTNRKETITGDGATQVYTLSNKNVNIASITYTITGSDSVTTTYTLTSGTDYTYDLATAKLTFAAVTTSGRVYTVTETIFPASGTNTIEIGYTYPTNYRYQVMAMRFSETYNGETDTRVFLYGDGTNKALYSGLDYDGNPRADYFPDLYEVTVDSANTPITAMIKHFDKLLVFKTDGAYETVYGTMTLADGTTTAGFYTSPLNREIGHAALGQLALVKNNPLTLYENGVYEWRMSSYYAKDERLAKRMSPRVEQTLSGMVLSDAVVFDDIFNAEYWISAGGTSVIYNYNADAWYVYGGISPSSFVSIGGELYIGDTSGNVLRFSRDYLNDDGANISAYWESGSMSFGADWLTKYSPCLWVGIKPEKYGCVGVTVETDRRSDYDARSVASGFFGFDDLDFTRLSFNVSDKPQMKRLRLKVKRFTYYKLIFSSDSNRTTATVTTAVMRVRYASDVR